MIDASQIREHMEVVGSDGRHVGTVDHMEGQDKIKLTKDDRLAGGEHHLIPLDWVDRVDTSVHLSRSSLRVMEEWTTMH